MNKIIFKISKNLLTISLLNKETKTEDLNNTNIIDTKEILFSEDYISTNLDLVSSFLNVIIIKREVSRVIIKDYDIIPTILKIINLIPSIKDLFIKPEKSINYEMFLLLLDNKYLESINVYDIPQYLVERLDVNKGLDITIRSEILFISKFMEDNKLNTYSDIFYKKYIIINRIFDDNEKNEFETFMNINKYLKVIEFIYLNEETFNYISEYILNHHLENIKLIFNEETLDLEKTYPYIIKFKKKYERILKERNIILKINYSDNYKKNNFLKQLNLNFIKVSLISIIIVVLGMMSINIYKNYSDQEQYTNIENDLNKIMNTIEDNPEQENDFEIIEPTDEDLTTTTTTTSIYQKKYEKVFDQLLNINKDTVGWLTVNNTNIDYPVVQSNDNDYYLKRDYYKQKNRHGWIFVDYRNSIDELDRNTIIYGHNLANQTMFGTLRYSLNSSWYKKTKNQIITFNTTEKNMKWQIISIYKVPVTTDYLLVTFKTDDEYLNFLKMITKRSIYDFKQTYDANTKILTLSTCSNGHKQRLVVHAKLITED